MVRTLYGDDRQTAEALEAFDALSHPTRLGTVMRLIERGSEGIPAGELATLAGVKQNTMSQHLGVLARAQILRARRERKHIVYRVNFPRLRQIAAFVQLAADRENAPDGSPAPSAGSWGL